MEHLARKLAVLVETEPVLLEKLSENGQLELLYDMEQPLAFVLAKMEIAGITVKKETLLEMQAENDLVIEKLTQEIYELAGEEFNINSPKQLGALLFEKLGLPLEYTKKPRLSTRQRWMSWSALLRLLRLLRKSSTTVRLLRFSLLM